MSGNAPKISRLADSRQLTKDGGTFVRYYLFPEYEIHYNELVAGGSQQWHRHDVIEETIYVVSGQVDVLWRDDYGEHRTALDAGDVVRFGAAPHTLVNTSDSRTVFLVFKLVLDGCDKRAIFQSDKVPDEPLRSA
jgi:uncharacterized cupin superfamily protein